MGRVTYEGKGGSYKGTCVLGYDYIVHVPLCLSVLTMLTCTL